MFQVVGPTLGIDAATNVLTVMDPTPKPQKFTVIFEYALPVDCDDDTLEWAERWHALGEEDFGKHYNKALREITNDFAGADADADKPNGNALNQLRTNEVALMGARFPIPGSSPRSSSGSCASSGSRRPDRSRTRSTSSPVAISTSRRPDRSAARARARASSSITSTECRRSAERDARVAGPMSGNSALVGSAPYGAWGKLVNPNPPTIASQGIAHELGDVAIDVRDTFALNTCAGCHRHETDTRHFMHITMLAAMEPADKVDDRARVGVLPGTPEDTIVLSNLLTADISPGGARFEDFSALLLGESP